jgi:hypothetical protein
MRVFSMLKKQAGRAGEWARQHSRDLFVVAPGAAMAAVVLAPPGSPFLPASFSLDLSGMVTFAETIFNALSPIVVIVGGIVLGLGLVGLILSLVMKAVRGGGKA